MTELPAHSFKFAAALQAHQQSTMKPVLDQDRCGVQGHGAGKLTTKSLMTHQIFYHFYFTTQIQRLIIGKIKLGAHKTSNSR